MAVCHGQVVQLPAVASFEINTTVSVPDQGTGSLGGVGRSSYGTASRGVGPIASTARGGVTGANSASVSATVIDLAAMDAALLNMPPDRQHVPNYGTRRQGTKIVNTLTPQHYDREIKRSHAPPHPTDWMIALGSQGNDHVDSAENKLRDGSNARYFMEKAAAAQSLGHESAARVYYQMALDRMTATQKQRIEEIKAARAAEEAAKFKKGKGDTKTPEAAPSAAPSSPAATSDSSASPFDAPAAQPDAKMDMTSSPF